MCHQLGAAGVPGEFPRLAGRAGKIAGAGAVRLARRQPVPAVLPDSMPDLPDSTLVASPESAAPEEVAPVH